MDDRNDLYDTVIKAAGVCLAIALWYISMRFSVDGFEIATEEDAWIGWTLGALVTYLQVLFNRGSKNETMYWAGIIAYVYGLATNLMGIMAVRGEAFTLSMFGDNFFGALLQITVVFAIAAAVEILPEHLFINALRPDGQDGDFITSLKKGLDGIRTPSRGNRSGGGQNRGGSNQKRGGGGNQGGNSGGGSGGNSGKNRGGNDPRVRTNREHIPSGGSSAYHTDPRDM